MRGRSRSRERDHCHGCNGACQEKRRSISGGPIPRDSPADRSYPARGDFDGPRERSRDRSLSPGRIHRAWHRFWHPFHHHHHHDHHPHPPPPPPNCPPPYNQPQHPPPYCPPSSSPFTLQVRDRTADDPRPYNPHGRNFTITVTPETRPCDIIYSLAPPRSRCTILVCSTFQPAYVMPKDVSLPDIASMGCWLEVVDR
ncbi:hypothetical protein jhhlp_008046 [Lomentospora prolificans]|uniref:Uncharacterized protein n=1 Tax=Lomentospora prolificans TaxID=41688 RepID=A0A2N3MZD0_9PEZI|nr:hypothetical protein jhhlp_008046 [Lomentospora prolificans]